MFSLEFYQLICYSVFIMSVIAYATLDGFDLGVGCMHLFSKGDNERRLMINAIGPVWDSNTTWIVIGGGVLFAAFPKAFAIIMEGFYSPVMILIFGYVLRGAAVEFRSKHPEQRWRTFWDVVFFIASLSVAFIIGVTLGNLIDGVPISDGHIDSSFLEMLRPYPILVSIFGISLFVLHGSIYLFMKTEGELHNRLRKRIKHAIWAFLILWALTTTATIFLNTRMIYPFMHHPSLLIFVVLSLLSIASIPHFIARRQDGMAFIASSATIFFLLILFVIGTFPYFVHFPFATDLNSLTLYNSSATKTALSVIVLIVICGLPLSFFYIPYLFQTFKGKIKLDPMSY